MKKIVLSTFFIFVVIGLKAQIFRPLAQMSEVERSVFLAEHFWDGFPFHDTMVLKQEDRMGRNVVGGAVANYLQEIRFAELPIIQQSLVNTLKKSDTVERMYRYFIETLDFYLNEALSGLREERWIVPVWQEMLKSKWCTATDSAQVNFFLKMAAKNPVGATATDLDYVSIEGDTGKLSEIDAELLLIYFYVPGCPQCVKTREWIEEDTAYQELHKAGILKVFAFYPEKDMEKFHTYNNTIPATWMNVRDPDGRSQLEEEEKYQMRGAPTMYLLDKNKTIILKDAREDLLFEEFAKARNQRMPQSPTRIPASPTPR